MPVRTLGPGGKRVVRSHVDWGGELNIFYKHMETLPYKHMETLPNRRVLKP